eukprot:9332407-Pyramimonas_sp.AAC.1
MCVHICIEDAYGEPPPPPAFWNRPCGRALRPRLCQANGAWVPQAVVETLRGTRGGERRSREEGR